MKRRRTLADPTADRSARTAVGAGSAPPPTEVENLLDQVKATTIALLASLQDKERSLRERASTDASPGIRRGLSDIRALRRWANRTLRTLAVLESGRRGELHQLVDELGEFGEILRTRQPAPARGPID